MAAKSTLYLIAELERRYLECGVCSETFNEENRVPRLLPCHHSFCTACLKKILRKGFVKCPACNTKHKLQENTVLKFPKDNTRRDLTFFIETHTKRSKCENCETVSSLVYQCIVCIKCFCELCKMNHEKNNQDHEFKIDTKFVQMDDENKDTCRNPGHNNAEYKYFCNSPSCQCTVCPMCVVEDHRDKNEHELEDIQTAFDSRQSALNSSLSYLKDRISQVKDSKGMASIEVKLVTNAKHEFKETVNELFDRGLKKLQHQRDSLIEMYYSKFENNERKLQSIVGELDNFIANSEECCNLTEELLKTKSVSSFLNVHQVMNRHVLQFLNLPLKENEVLEHVDYTEEIESFKAYTEANTSDGQSHGLEDEKPSKNEIRKCSEKWWPWTKERNRNGAIGRLHRGELKNILIFLFFMCVQFMPIAYIVPENFFKELRWTAKINSCFVCRNPQNTTYATFQETNNMVCGARNKLYIFKGVFLNSTLDPRKQNGFDFTVRFKQNHNHVFADDRTVIFEFGLVAQKTTHVKYIGLETKFCFNFYACSNALELCMKTGDGQNIDISRLFFESKVTGYMEGIFHFGFNRDSSVSLVNLKRNETVYIFDNLYTSKRLKPVFAAYESVRFSTIFTILSRQPFEFNRTSLHSSLFTSTDNRVVSNKKTSFTYKHADTYDSYIFTKRRTFRYSNTRVAFEIHYTVQDEDKNMDSFLEFGLGYYKNNSFHVVKIYKLVPCILTYYFVLKRTGYCLKDESNKLLTANTPIRLYIHNTYDGSFNLFNKGVLHDYNFMKIDIIDKIDPILYVKRLGGTEIKINNDDARRLMDIGFPFIQELFEYLYNLLLSYLDIHR